MGSGKSTTGPHLAKLLKYSFIDQDELIEKVAKSSVSQIFREEGENGFRDIETQVLKQIGQRHSLVVATGGGLVTRSENWGVLHQGIVIWLDPNRELLFARLKSDKTVVRPLLDNKDPKDVLDSLIKQRYLSYAEADLHISIERETPEEVALVIFKKLSEIIRVQED
ncbi:Shikimate kinase I [Prochlorococcus marinus str. SS51]|nr:Shikimate kinase I [Prochlorococcus marinus str. SS51]